MTTRPPARTVGRVTTTTPHDTAPGTARHTVWRVPAFRRFWVAETVSAAGTGIGAVALPVVAVAVLHAQPFSLGVLEAAVWAPWLVFGLLAGAVVDRTPARPLMVGCDLAAAAAFLTVPVAAALGRLGVVQLVVVALVAGSVEVFSQATRQSVPPALVDPGLLAQADTALATSGSVTDVAAAPVSGALTAAFGAVAGVAADAASFLVSAVLLIGVRVPRPADRPHQGQRGGEPAGGWSGMRREIGEGLRFVVADRWLRTLGVTAGLANLILTGVGALQTLLLLRVAGVSPGWVGPLLVGEGAGGVVGAALATRLADRVGSCRALVSLALGGPVAGLAVAATGPGPALAAFVLGTTASTAAVVGGNVLTAVFRHRYVPAELLGRVGAAMRVLAYAAAPLGAVLAGTLASAIGIRPAVTALLGVGVVRGLLFLRRPWRGTRDLPTAPPGDVEGGTQ